MTETIIICDRCRGSGKVQQKKLEDYHHGTYYEWDEPCPRCGGTGRMVRQENVRKLRADELELRPKPEDIEEES